MIKKPPERAAFLSVLQEKTLVTYQRIGHQFLAFQILPAHVYSGDLSVFIGGVIIDALPGVAAGGIGGKLVCFILQTDAAALLRHRRENLR